jgi:hypothetical protein
MEKDRLDGLSGLMPPLVGGGEDRRLQLVLLGRLETLGLLERLGFLLPALGREVLRLRPREVLALLELLGVVAVELLLAIRPRVEEPLAGDLEAVPAVPEAEEDRRW